MIIKSTYLYAIQDDNWATFLFMATNPRGAFLFTPSTVTSDVTYDTKAAQVWYELREDVREFMERNGLQGETQEFKGYMLFKMSVRTQLTDGQVMAMKLQKDPVPYKIISNGMVDVFVQREVY